MPLMLVSPAIPPGGEIPAHYTCDGADISPPLSWLDRPILAEMTIHRPEDRG